MLIEGFKNSVEKFPDNIALEVQGERITYAELAQEVKLLAPFLLANESHVGVLASRSKSAYLGVLASLWCGKAYVPLSNQFPVKRTFAMCSAVGLRTIVVGDESVSYLKTLLSEFTEKYRFIFPETLPFELAGGHELIFLQEEIKATEIQTPDTPDAIAYVLFTSGSTGVPKGVPVSNSNATTYIDYICNNYSISSNDRVSQAFSLTFDPSVHDMFTTWKVGATLCVVPEKELMAPAKFIKENRLTIWYSVPSIGRMMLKLRLLKPNSFPDLKYAFFSAEMLTEAVASAWQLAAPSAKVINFYGPTEVTVNVTEYEWDTVKSPALCKNGGVPIGKIYDTVVYLILDENGSKSKKGELYLGGNQLTAGYLNNEEKTAAHYVVIDGEPYFRTGDLVAEMSEDCLHFLGRIDEQVKIRGFRVELSEITCRVRQAVGIEDVVTLALQDSEGSIAKLVTFIGNQEVEIAKVRDFCSQHLPDYMIPSDFVLLDRLPINANGKVDKVKLKELI